MGNPVSAKSALDIARTALGEAMTQTPATLATWDRGGGIHTNILIDGTSWRWYAAGYVVPAGRTSVPVTATGGGVWVQGVSTNGLAGNYVSANPAPTGPVMIIQSGFYVAASPAMLAALSAQLYLKGTDGLYVGGLVPIVWPGGVTAGYRLVLQAQSGGTNILWLAPGAPIPATLGTGDNAYVSLGTAGIATDTVIFNPQPPYFDNSAIRTSDRFLAATYATLTALETVYTKIGTFTGNIYDQAGAPVSARNVEINAGGTTGIYRYLRSSYPAGNAAFINGSVVTIATHAGATGLMTAVMRATGTTVPTYTALETRLSTTTNTIALFSVLNGVSTQIGTSVAKGTVSNDVYWIIRMACIDTSIRCRAWLSNAAEPTVWDIDTTQAAIATAGLAGFGTDITFGKYSFFGVSRGDSAAPVL